MKRFFCIVSLLTIVLALGFSCTNDDTLAPTYPIFFRCSDLTRAEAKLEDIQDNGFRVYAFFQAAPSVGNVTGSFDKAVAWSDTANGGDGGWIYNPIEYWIPGATYYFKAFYPKDIAAVVNNTNSAQSYTISNYDVTLQHDLLVAEARDIVVDSTTGEPSTGSVVNLTFEHLLSCVTIAAKTKIDGVEVKRITLNGVATTATFENGSWASSQTTSLTKNHKTTLRSSSVDYVDVADGGFLLVPEVVNGGQELIIETSKKTYTVVIPEITWESNKKYTYTLTIEQNDILFDEPAIAEPWDETNATGSVIIK